MSLIKLHNVESKAKEGRCSANVYEQQSDDDIWVLLICQLMHFLSPLVGVCDATRPHFLNSSSLKKHPAAVDGTDLRHFRQKFNNHFFFSNNANFQSNIQILAG